MPIDKTTDIESEKKIIYRRSLRRFFAGAVISMIPAFWPLVYPPRIQVPDKTTIIKHSEVVKNLASELDKLNQERIYSENNPRLKNAMASLNEYISEITSRRNVVEYNQALESYRSLEQKRNFAMLGGFLTMMTGSCLSMYYSIRKEKKELTDLS